MDIYQCSRRTINSGEVVTFATGFKRAEGVFGEYYTASGPFDISASRDAVIVHYASARTLEEAEAVKQAITLAYQAKEQLSPTWRGGADSMFPPTPTLLRASSTRI